MTFWNRYILFVLAVLASVVMSAQQIVDNASTSERLVSIGDAFFQAGNIDKAIELYNEALATSTTIDEKWESTDRLARICMQKELNDEALKHYGDIISDSRISTDSTILMQAYARIGQIYHNIHDYVKAIKSYNKVEECIHSNGNRDLKNELYVNIAKTKMVAGDIVESERLLQSVVSSIPEDRPTIVLADALGAFAELYCSIERYQEAYDCKYRQQVVLKRLWNSERAELLDAKSPWGYFQKAELNVENERRVKELELELSSRKDKDGRDFVIICIVAFVAIVAILFSLMMFIGDRKRKMVIRQLSSSNDEKKHVMSIVAHDFINPFNALIGFAELQMQYAQAQNDAELLNYSRTIYNSAQTLFQMVGNVLAWSQVDGQMSARFEIVNVSSEIEKIVAVYRLMAEEKGVHINVSVTDDVEASADVNHFNIVLRNVLSNALKFTPTGGRISISALMYQGKTSVIVDDTGIGMSKATVDRINSALTVDSTAGTARERGVGLGLAICHDLVRANKGTFEVASIEGKGTTVTLVFESK